MIKKYLKGCVDLPFWARACIIVISFVLFWFGLPEVLLVIPVIIICIFITLLDGFITTAIKDYIGD